MGRSLLTKAYLYGAALFATCGLGALGGAYFLLETGHLDAVRQFGQTQALLLAGELERDATAQGPEPKRVARLGRLVHARVRFLPWSSHDYPPTLAADKVAFEPGWLPGRSWRRYWVRLDRGHEALGVLLIDYGPSHPTALAHVPGLMMLTGLGGLAILLLPPIWFWVLRPLERMVAVAHRLAAGDLHTPVPRTRDDELGDLEAAFEGLRRQVQQTLMQKEKLLGDMSHELRGPLSRMAIALPMLHPAPEDARPYAALDREIGAMDALIGELLALARAQTPTALAKAPVDLAQIAGELVASRALAAQAAGLTIEASLQPAPASGDAGQLARAMGNLLDNALRYTPPGGRVRVSTAHADGQSTFEVADTGPGVHPDDLPLLFEPFYRPDASRSRATGGTGLGLAIVKATLDAHGGRAELSLAEAGGLVAKLALPAA